MVDDALTEIKALAFDTGGTVFNWHDSLVKAFIVAGMRHGLKVDWHQVANDWRRRALSDILGQTSPNRNLDEVHRRTLDLTLTQFGIESITADERVGLMRTWHDLDVWPDFPGAIAAIRAAYPIVSFTILPVSVVVSNSRRNGISWDAVISCEMIGHYKPHPQAYATAAKWLRLKPSQILMVACHNLDLNAAHKAGFRTAFVRRPAEWGPVGQPDAQPNMDFDLIENGFDELKNRLPSPIATVAAVT